MFKLKRPMRSLASGAGYQEDRTLRKYRYSIREPKYLSRSGAPLFGTLYTARNEYATFTALWRTHSMWNMTYAFSDRFRIFTAQQILAQL